MYETNLLTESRISDWLVVFGYISITLFIMWQVVNTKPR